MTRTQEEWLSEYVKRNAGWMHDGNPRRPHVILASKKHSSGFFQSNLVFEQNDPLRREAASDLVELLIRSGQNIMHIDCVVGPATGATKLAEAIASVIAEARGYPCRWASPEKEEIPGGTIMSFRSTSIERGDRAILCEDVLSTGGSLERAGNAVIRAGGSTLYRALAIVNRSGELFVNGRQAIALVDRHLPAWDLEKEPCPLCATGSVAILPKIPPDNWELLTREYPESVS